MQQFASLALYHAMFTLTAFSQLESRLQTIFPEQSTVSHFKNPIAIQHIFLYHHHPRFHWSIDFLLPSSSMSQPLLDGFFDRLWMCSNPCSFLVCSDSVFSWDAARMSQFLTRSNRVLPMNASQDFQSCCAELFDIIGVKGGCLHIAGEGWFYHCFVEQASKLDGYVFVQECRCQLHLIRPSYGDTVLNMEPLLPSGVPPYPPYLQWFILSTSVPSSFTGGLFPLLVYSSLDVNFQSFL